MSRLTPIAVRIADSIADGITDGTYPAGSQLPAMSEIENIEDCSRSTVQRAFAILTHRGLVVGLQGKAMFVAGGPQQRTNNPSLAQLGVQRDGHLYVIEFVAGLAKVGFSTRPKIRVGNHARDARLRNDSIRRSWISKPHPEAAAHEAALLAFARSRYQLAHGAEYFRGADFDALVARARLLLDEKPSDEPLTLFAA